MVGAFAAPLVFCAGYLFGSIPSSYWAGRVFAGADVRQTGDHNVGAGNVLAIAGRRAFLFALAGDILKAFALVELCAIAGMGQVELFLASLAVVAGHIWPITLGFHGGRGVAPSIGALTALSPVPSLILAPFALISGLVTGNTVLATAIFFAPLPFLVLFLGYGHSEALFAIFLSLLCFGKHLFDQNASRRSMR